MAKRTSKRKPNRNQVKGAQNRNRNYDRRDKQMSDEKEVRHDFNDVSWYSKNEAMLRDAASYSYNNPLGLNIPWSTIFDASTTTLVYRSQMSVPGLMSMRFVPTIGLSKDSTSPANLAAQNIYSYVRYMNSGAKNYDQADLMLYLMAMDSIYMMWNWAKRIYGYARVFAQKNRYLPRVFFGADGVDYYDTMGSLADFRYKLNQLASQISSFCVPAVMPLLVRHSWMVSNIYKDSDDDKAQMYMYSPAGYYQYDETGSEYGGQLIWKSNALGMSSVTKWSTICWNIQQMLNAVAYSEDIGVMSGDILKAYGQEKLFKISPVEPEYEVLPVYNEEVLNQIHNSTQCDVTDLINSGKLDITQDPDSGYLIWDPIFKAPAIDRSQAFVNMPWNEVTPANTMVGTRLITLTDSTGNVGKLATCGSEIITSRYIMSLSSTGVVSEMVMPDYLMFGTSATANTDAPVLASYISNFDWHPLVPILTQTGSGSAVSTMFHGVLGDINNYTIISGEQIKNMNLTALESEFNVPQIGSF